MKNLNERHEDEEITTADIAGKSQPHRGEVIPISQQRTTSRPEGEPSLLAGDEVDEFRSRWTAIQSSFVDEPKSSIESADKLVAQAIKRIADGFYEERMKLERQWKTGGDVSTEDLRQSLQRYRSFFSRLLSM
jgi:hypothetical protein